MLWRAVRKLLFRPLYDAREKARWDLRQPEVQQVSRTLLHTHSPCQTIPP